MATLEAGPRHKKEILNCFPLLSDPDYEPNTFEYKQSPAEHEPSLAEWIDVARKSIPSFKEHAEQDTKVEDSKRKAEDFAKRYGDICDALTENPTADVPPYGSARTDCIRLVQLREDCLRDAGFHDPYAEIKAQENEKALKLLPDIIAQADRVEGDRERLEHVVKGVFAGNIFDLGASGTAQQYKDGGDAGAMFQGARDDLKPRPWAVDTLDEMLRAFDPIHKGGGGGYKKALVFVDNAGADVVLGMLPFVRELLKRGTAVVIACNEEPSINDVTAHEMRGVIAAAKKADSAICAAVERGALRVVSSGNGLPVIDLRKVSDSVVDEANAGVDLVVLEGMGRGIETNLYAQFTVDSLKLAMIKHPEVAQCLKTEVYTPVCNFMPGKPRVAEE